MEPKQRRSAKSSHALLTKCSPRYKNDKPKKENMSLDTLEKLYISELRDLYSAENQLLKALPKSGDASSVYAG